MPVMPRTNSKAKKIAYRILGTPANIEKKKTRKQNKTEKRLVFEETVLSR